MPVLSAPKIEQLARAADPKKAIIEAVGDLTNVKVQKDLVLVGTFIRNEMTSGGIIRPLDNVKEDEHQGKVGLVLKVGPVAYADWEDEATAGNDAILHTWVIYQGTHSWPIQLNGVPCRMVPYDKLRMTIPDPTMVF
jgi:co-chaperonin GroES (HSP10)